MLQSRFNKVAQKFFIEKRLQHNFPVNIAKLLRTAFFYRKPFDLTLIYTLESIAFHHVRCRKRVFLL